MLFRRTRPKPQAPWPSEAIAFRFGSWLGSLGHRMARWPRLTRASIVLVGMATTIVLFWTGNPGWAVCIGAVALAVFWLSVNPTGADLAQQDGIEVLPAHTSKD